MPSQSLTTRRFATGSATCAQSSRGLTRCVHKQGVNLPEGSGAPTRPERREQVRAQEPSYYLPSLGTIHHRSLNPLSRQPQKIEQRRVLSRHERFELVPQTARETRARASRGDGHEQIPPANDSRHNEVGLLERVNDVRQNAGALGVDTHLRVHLGIIGCGDDQRHPREIPGPVRAPHASDAARPREAPKRRRECGADCDDAGTGRQ